MPRSRPRLFLDVDGVIGRFGAETLGRSAILDGYADLNVDERIASWLPTLDDAFEIVWATSWFEDAKEFRHLRARWREPELNESSLLIQTDPVHGLTESHVQDLLAFAGRT